MSVANGATATVAVDENKKCDKQEKKVKFTVHSFMLEFSQCENRSQKWDFLYSTEYECESMELNEAMAAMTDEQVDTWFVRICSEYLCKKLREGVITC